MIRERDGSWGKSTCLRLPGGTDESEASAPVSPITALSFSGEGFSGDDLSGEDFSFEAESDFVPPEVDDSASLGSAGFESTGSLEPLVLWRLAWFFLRRPTNSLSIFRRCVRVALESDSEGSHHFVAIDRQRDPVATSRQGEILQLPCRGRFAVHPSLESVP